MSSVIVTSMPERDGVVVALRIADARDRRLITVSGRVVAAHAAVIGNSPAYCCELDDGTGILGVWFIGRDHVAGLDEGARCAVEGMVQIRHGRLIVWNPVYRLQWSDAT